MTEAAYHLLQEKLDKPRIGHRPTNKEFAFNSGVLACKSILKEKGLDEFILPVQVKCKHFHQKPAYGVRSAAEEAAQCSS